MGDSTIRGRGRSGRPWVRMQAQVRAEEPTCHLCGLPIPDLPAQARKHHPLASAIDHLVPLAHGGDPLDRANLHNAHRICGGSRGTQPITPAVRVRCRQLAEAAWTRHHTTAPTTPTTLRTL